MNLMREDDRSRLFQAMNRNYLKLEPYRALREKLVAEYAGSEYGNDGSIPQQTTVINLMAQAVDAYTMSLVANRPRVVIDTHHEDRKFFAKHFAVAVNNMLQEIGLEHTLRTAVVDAFFMLGIVKVHMGDSPEVQLWDGSWVNPGQPMASSVSLDDFVFDMQATRWDQVKYAADGYRVPLEDLKSDLFNQKVVDELQPTGKMEFTGVGQRVENLSRGYSTDSDDVIDMVDVMDVWVPRERKIYTFAMDPTARFYGNLPPLAVVDWDGPESGPYHLLTFSEVPDNIMATSPAMNLSTLARLANNVMRKLGKQARRQKEVMLYNAAGAKDASRVLRSSDGESCAVDDPTNIGQYKAGGADPALQAFALQTVDVFDRAAGNLSAMLGLGPQADTLGQEQLIAGSVSKKEAQMRMRVLDFTKKLVRNLSFMLWSDAVKEIPGRMPIEGVEGVTIDSTWTPEYRMGDFYDYDLDIDVFSMPYQPPESKVKALMGVMTQLYLPLQQQLASQGGQINFQSLTDQLAELMHLPRLKDVVTFGSPMPGEQMGGGEEGASKPPTTTRNYTRQQVPTEGTQAGKSIRMQQALLAQNMQRNPDAGVAQVSRGGA